MHTDGERKPSPGCEVCREDPVLSIVERAVSDSREDLAHDEERVAVEVVGRTTRHDNRAGQVEAREDDRHQSAAELVDVETESDA